jgi:hypothetical protein
MAAVRAKLSSPAKPAKKPAKKPATKKPAKGPRTRPNKDGKLARAYGPDVRIA